MIVEPAGCQEHKEISRVFLFCIFCQAPCLGKILKRSVVAGLCMGRKAAPGQLSLLEVGFQTLTADSAEIAGVGTWTALFVFVLFALHR